MQQRKTVTTLLIAFALIATSGPGAFAAPSATTSGSTVMDGDSITTAASPAVVHLANRRAVRIEPYSEARFQSSGNAVRVSVVSGQASYASANGMHAVAANESALIEPDSQLAPQSGSSGGGSTVEMCELVNQEELDLCSVTPKDKKCEWKLINAQESEVEALIAQGARYQGEDGLDCDNDKGPLIAIGAGAAAAAALGAGQIAGIVAGGVLGAVVVGNNVDDSGSTQPVVGVSPIN